MRKPPGYWTLERCMADAQQYTTKSAWARAPAGAYNAARNNDWVAQCRAHMVTMKRPKGFWTLERCQEDALQYDTRGDWYAGSTGYYHANSNNWLELCCQHMREVIKPPGYWTLERCQEDSLQYDTRRAWGIGNSGAYNAAVRNDWLALCRGHMTRGATSSDNDAIYIWRAVGQFAWQTRLYKIGVTSFRLGDTRIKACAANQGLTPAVKAFTRVTNAYALEAKLLALGRWPHWLEGDGYTEFRALSDSELQEAIQYIEEVAA